MDGEPTDDSPLVGGGEGPLLVPWNSFLTSTLGTDRTGVPFVAGAFAGTLPNDFTISDLILGAGTEEAWMGAEASSIEPKVTDEPGMCQQCERMPITNVSHTCFRANSGTARASDAILERHTLTKSTWSSRMSWCSGAISIRGR